jgi:multimeric flavodoxin WrbA
MKVILVNGSPHPKRCTYTALETVAGALAEEGVGGEFFHVGTKPLSGCIDCRKCVKKGRCVFDDKVNEFLDIAAAADAFVFGSPVHYAAASGAMTSFMDRAFFSSFCSGRDLFRLKPGAVVVSARRAGTTAALDQLAKYLAWAEMPVISSRYWNMVHGNTSEEVKQDLEGMQVMRALGRNMAWFLKCKEAGAKAGIPLPEREPRVSTNFIR